MKYSRGFTLIEILLVLAIMGILSSVVLVALNSSREKALIAKAETQLASIRSAMEVMASETDEWPGHQLPNTVYTGVDINEIEDISAPAAGMSANPGGAPYEDWNGPYMPAGFLDPWGNPYFFDTDYDLNGGVAPLNEGVVIGSYGPNGTGPNNYDEDDIIKILVGNE